MQQLFICTIFPLRQYNQSNINTIFKIYDSMSESSSLTLSVPTKFDSSCDKIISFPNPGEVFHEEKKGITTHQSRNQYQNLKDLCLPLPVKRRSSSMLC